MYFEFTISRKLCFEKKKSGNVSILLTMAYIFFRRPGAIDLNKKEIFTLFVFIYGPYLNTVSGDVLLC